nr:MAG TPA: hypothetical protein [Crassvirales sp.]
MEDLDVLLRVYMSNLGSTTKKVINDILEEENTKYKQNHK